MLTWLPWGELWIGDIDTVGFAVALVVLFFLLANENSRFSERLEPDLLLVGILLVVAVLYNAHSRLSSQ